MILTYQGMFCDRSYSSSKYRFRITKVLEPWAPFSVRQFNGLKVVVDKVEELSTFPIQCLKCHLSQFDVVNTIDFFVIVPRNFTWEYGYGLE